MVGTDIIGMLVFAVISLASAALALGLSARFVPATRPAGVPSGRQVFSNVTRRYEFREGYLLSSVDPNDAFLDAEIDRSHAFEALSHTLSDLNPEVAPRLQALTGRGEAFLLTCAFSSDALTLSGRKEDDNVILTVGPAETAPGRESVDTAMLDALTTETEELRNTIDRSPMLVWKQDRDGQIQWADASYFALLDQLSGDDETVTWPVPRIFDVDPDDIVETGSVSRHRLDLPDDAEALNFEITGQRHRDGTTVFMALRVDRLIAAETALRSFVQTLSQTFAHLPIGLAVFDKKRELVLFNPALTELSTLDIQFLSNRPSLVDFLDGLRDRQRMPEPKNYRNWRDEIARLEQGAEEGSYQEMWTLPNGQSFRVIGRPHPDGAVAFMFEDISSEVSLTRKFRGDLELYQSVLDDMPGALAVFANDGQLVLRNSGYEAVWGAGLTPVSSLSDVIQIWQARSRPSPVWSDLKSFATGQMDRKAWTEVVSLEDGTELICRVAPLAGGATLVQFQPVDAPNCVDDDFSDVPFFRALAGAAEPVRVAYEAAEAPAEFVSHRRATRPTGTDPD